MTYDSRVQVPGSTTGVWCHFEIEVVFFLAAKIIPRRVSIAAPIDRNLQPIRTYPFVLTILQDQR